MVFCGWLLAHSEEHLLINDVSGNAGDVEQHNTHLGTYIYIYVCVYEEWRIYRLMEGWMDRSIDIDTWTGR
jgi:hypothetical protein